MMHWIKMIFFKWLKPKYKFTFLVDLPENIKNKSIYIVGDKKYQWLIAFNCPCGCKALIQLNLLKEAKPCWSYSVNKKGEISITPSVWRKNGCESHFIVRNNKIDWVKNHKT